MTTSTNFGVTLKKGAVSVADLTNIDFPKVSTGAIESTNHSSGGYREYIPDGLIEVETFSVTAIGTKAVYTAIKADIDAGTTATYKLDFTVASGITDWSFSCFPVSIEITTADAQSPDIVEFNVEMRPTSTLTW